MSLQVIKRENKVANNNGQSTFNNEERKLTFQDVKGTPNAIP